MSITSSILKAGALYAIGRAAQNISRDDISRVTGLTGDDLRNYGVDRLDTLLGTMGLQRHATVPNGTAMILSGFAAGAIVGAGVTFLFYTEQGEAVRGKIGEFFSGSGEKGSSEAASGESAQGASAGGNGANVSA